MKGKNIIDNNTPSKLSNDIVVLVDKKINFFQYVIQKTIINIQKNKTLDILGVNEVNACINSLNILNEKINELLLNMHTIPNDSVINSLQNINNELSGLLKLYGTESLDDLLLICWGNNNSIISSDEETLKYDLLKKYFHPTSYKVVSITKNNKSKTSMSTSTCSSSSIDDNISDNIKNLDCYNIAFNVKSFYMKVYGIKLYIYHPLFKKSILISGVVDDIMIGFLNNIFIHSKIKKIKDFLPKNPDFNNENFDRFISSLTLKDYLIYDNIEVYNKYAGIISQDKLLKQKLLSQIVKDFLSSELYEKRELLIHFLINSLNYDNKYIAYLLYDLISNDVNGKIDTYEQMILIDSFPWSIKQYFRDAMKKTVQYTNEISNFDINKIPLEQQICILKTNDTVKEKAMMKLKEIKAKSEDSGSKARQYLDGLLKIPFSIYKKEPIMNVMNETKYIFNNLIQTHGNILSQNAIIKENYTSIEIIQYLKKYKNKTHFENIITEEVIKSYFDTIDPDKSTLVAIILEMNDFILSHELNIQKIKYSNKNKEGLKECIIKFIDFCNQHNYIDIIQQLFINKHIIDKDVVEIIPIPEIDKIENNFSLIQEYMSNIKKTLDLSVHGHDKAKIQLERIIGQWINGEHDGYCFGFEGPPGVGKTSLAKYGLSNCLKDNDGISRPFAMIQMGGDSNGSTLHGHNYTYVGSTWGSIVQILIDKKCMNPIIFIDEIDKISKTEHGKEMIGILTHLLDPTQNDSFQDKYFSGIDLDLSKALFILSYNDVGAIDKILLDRIHRIKFSNLSIEDKLVISNVHLLPNIFKKMGLEGIINLNNDVLKFIIDEYTCEAGVRKLKEILFEIVGEINLDILKNKLNDYEFPIEITIDNVANKYFKDKPNMNAKKIHLENKVGIINGMWANSMGQGGIIPIQVNYYPSDKFLDLKLTGMQGDVMKESMNVALTLAWNLTDEVNKKRIRENHNYGLHVHCPEGSVPKDGPSAGTAITSVIYSLFNNKKIKNNIAITGEISLDGNVTQIGGLDCKFLGSIKAGVTYFIYPEENQKDYQKFIDKYKDSDLIKNITFHKVKHISEVIDVIFE